jgi:hypothetical protein
MGKPIPNCCHSVVGNHVCILPTQSRDEESAQEPSRQSRFESRIHTLHTSISSKVTSKESWCLNGQRESGTLDAHVSGTISLYHTRGLS